MFCLYKELFVLRISNAQMKGFEFCLIMLCFYVDTASTMKLKVSNYSAGLKSSSLRTSVPVFTTKLRNHYGRQGDTFKLQCRVDGEPQPVISWLKEGKPLLENNRIKVSLHLTVTKILLDNIVLHGVRENFIVLVCKQKFLP